MYVTSNVIGNLMPLLFAGRHTDPSHVRSIKGGEGWGVFLRESAIDPILLPEFFKGVVHLRLHWALEVAFHLESERKGRQANKLIS